jgi:hypothetical protein
MKRSSYARNASDLDLFYIKAEKEVLELNNKC